MYLSHLKKLLDEHGITQTGLAELLGRDKSVITNLLQGKRQLKASEAALIARHLGVPLERVIGGAQASGFSEPEHLIPFQAEPKGGAKHPQILRKEGSFYLQTQETIAKSPGAFALQMQDDSMNLAGILAGDILLSDMNKPCKAGNIVIVQHYKSRSAQTLVRRFEPPFLTAHSTRPDFAPINSKQEDIRLVSPVLKLIRLY